MLVTRLANVFLTPVWNKQYVESVHVVMKEDFGAQGRVKYFDEAGIIRDDIQSHMLQARAAAGRELG